MAQFLHEDREGDDRERERLPQMLFSSRMWGYGCRRTIFCVFDRCREFDRLVGEYFSLNRYPSEQTCVAESADVVQREP